MRKKWFWLWPWGRGRRGKYLRGWQGRDMGTASGTQKTEKENNRHTSKHIKITLKLNELTQIEGRNCQNEFVLSSAGCGVQETHFRFGYK